MLAGATLVSKSIQKFLVQFAWYHPRSSWGYPKLAGWFTKENPIKMDDLGVPPFQETSSSSATWQRPGDQRPGDQRPGAVIHCSGVELLDFS